MDNTKMLLYLAGGVGILFVVIIIAYLVIKNKLNTKEVKKLKELRKGTKSSSFSSEIFLQKMYVFYMRIPFVKRYLFKVRRRLEILNLEDEFLTRKQASKILTIAFSLTLVLAIIIIFMAKENPLLLTILLIFEVFLLDTVIDGMVDKIDNKLLIQQINFFSEIRHAYHEYNMVEEAIYQVAQEDELEVSRQANKIYEVLISDDPETELEKYYDIAPNSYLKEFAGVSYLTKEFGDRESDGASLYLKNLNNITQEMQLEILKRDKLNYVFQSLSVIALVPVLGLEAIKGWSVSSFSFTQSFYHGKLGMIAQILVLVVSFVCYLLIKQLKDNGSTKITQNSENPWQAKVYKSTLGKKIVDLFIPKKGTKSFEKVTQLLKDSASKLKMEWLYVNRICLGIVVFIISLILFIQLHKIAVDYIYTEPTADYNIIGQMSDKDYEKAINLTEIDNYFLERFKSKPDATETEIEIDIQNSTKYYQDATNEEIKVAAERIYDKLQVINSEYLKWFELLLAFVFMVIGYMSPIWLLMFQLRMRQMEMENEVMQFQTIILMLMKIERVNVEMILEWLERYANYFKAPISKCVNNYESGAWEALEELKNDISFQQLIRIVESLQAAVEKIPISQAFDELDTERAYHQEKRKESNERLISKKSLIGKVIGFAPMVCLFVGYLIIPLVVIGMFSMTSSFSAMSGM